MKKIGMLFALLAGALLATQSQAQAPGQSYFGIGIASAWSDGASPYDDTKDEDTAGAGKIYYGHMWSNWGMELGGYYLGKYDVEFGGSKIAESEATAIVVSGVYAADIGAGFTFHGKVGIAFTQFKIDCLQQCGNGTPPLADTKKTGLSGMWALGIGAKFSQNWLARMEWEHIGAFHSAVSDYEYKEPYDLFTVSLQFHF
jgi:Outer membrane protein beta-barrel domain